MNNMTIGEWEAMLEAMRSVMSAAYPLLDISTRTKSPEEVVFRLAYYTLSISLRSKRGVMTPQVSMDSSPTLPRDPFDAQASIDAAQSVLQAGRSAVLWAAHRGKWPGAVWADGECPCDFCGQRGTIRSAACGHCDGKGTR